MRERSGQPSFFSSSEAIKRDLRDEGVSSVDAWREASDQPETRSRISRAYWQTACNKALEEFDLELFFKLESIQPEIVVDPDVIQASLFALLDSITSKQSSKIHEQIKSFVLIAQSHQIRVETVWFQQAIEKAFLQIMTAGDIEALSRLNAFVTSYPIKLSEETLQGVRRQLIETSQGTQTGSGSLNVSVLFPLLQRLGVSQTELGEWKLDWSMRDASMAQKLYENELLSRKQVQALYRFRFQQRGFLAFESDCFALAPDAELVQEAYQQLFDSSFQTSDFFEHFALLQRNTKTAPDLTRFEGRLKSVVMAYLREQMSTSLQGQKGRLSHAVQYLDRGLSISVSVSQTDVNEWYEWAIQEQNPRIFLEIAEVFTLRPTLDSKMLRQFFLSCLVNESPKTLSELSVLLGLPPGLTAEERDRAYHDALEQRQGQALMLVHRMAGGAPETQALFQYIDDLLVQGDVEQARACIETFHLPIDEERSTTIARQMLRAGDLEAWFEWSERYGQPEVSGSDAEVGLSRYADRIAVESFKGVEDEERLVECVKRVLHAAKLVLNEKGAHVIYAALITRRARVSQTSQSQLEHLSEIMNRDVGLSPSVHSEPNSFLNVLRRNPDITTQVLSHTVRAGDYVGLSRLMQMMRPGELVSRVEPLLDVIVADIAQFLGKSDQPNKQLAIKSVLSFFASQRGAVQDVLRSHLQEFTKTTWEHHAHNQETVLKSLLSLREMFSTTPPISQDQIDQLYLHSTPSTRETLKRFETYIPSSSVAQALFLKESGSRFVEKTYMDLCQVLKQRPTPETVGVLYARYEQVKNLPSVFALLGKTKIAPEFSQEQLSAWVQFLFQEALQPVTRLRGLLDLRQLGPITLSEEQLLSLYETLLEDKQSLVFVSGVTSGTPLQGAVRAFGAQHPEVLRSMCHKHMNTKTLSVDDVFYLSRVANVSQLFKGGEHRRYLLEQAFRDGDVTRLRHMETVLGEPLGISSAEAQKWYTMIFLWPSQFSQENYWFIRNRSKTPPSVEIVDARYRATRDGGGSPEPLIELAGIVETRPSQETIQSIFQEAFTQYLRAYDSNYSEDGELYENFGDELYKEYVDFVRCLHMKPVYTEAFAHESYQYCLAQGKSHAGKLSVIERETGFVLDEANIKAFLFDDKQIDAPCLEQIPLSMVEEHFAEPDNRSLIEYQRVYKVTGAYDYYQSVLEEYASGVAGRGPSEYARLLLTLLTVEQRRRDRFEPLFGRLMEVLKQLSGKIDASLKEGLESLMRSNLEKFQGEFLQWLRETTTPSKQSEVVQTLMQLEGYAVKFALYAWANTSDAQEVLKQEIVTFLMKQNFFSEDIASWLRRQRETEGEKTNVWGVLSAHASLEDIRNKSLKEQAYCLMDPLFARPGNELASDVNSLQDSFSSIPSHALLPLLAAFGKDERMLSLIDQSYQQQKQERVREKRLAQTLAYAKLPRQIQNLLQDSFHQRWSGESVDEFLGLATKLDILLHLSAPEQEMSDESISDEEKITRIDLFAQKIASAESVRDLDQWLSDKQREHFHHTFPSQSFSHEQIGLLVERFQGMEQLLGYAKKLKRLDSERVIQHFGEMLSAMDSTERWQDWRYDETNPLVNAQLAPLSKEQRLLWKEEICVDQGDVSIANDLLDRPALIAERLEQGWSQGHLYHPDLSPIERHRWIQEQLAIHSTNLQLPTVDRSSYVRGAIEEIQHQKETIGLFLRLQELSKIQSLIVDCERLEQEPTKQGSGPPTIAASRLKNLSDLLHSILPEEVFQRVMGQRMLDVSVRQQLSEQIQVLHQQAEAGFSADEFSRLGISIEQTKQPGILYKKQKELTALSQLLQLTQLTQRQIAQGYVSGIARKQGVSIEMQFDTLSQYFSDAPSFVQDIQNAKQVLGERERTSASKRRLAVLVTDDPFMMFQIGRYPHGVTSCQSHEGDFRLNRALLAYMGDAHIKGVFVIDLDQLPDEAQAMIEEQGMQALRQYTRSIDLLEASVARSVVKLVQDANKIQPALFIEPSYSAFGKSDGVIDHLITQTIKGTLSKTLRASTMRYGGTEMVQVPTSRNPQGQYEDAQAFHGGHGMGIQFGSYTMPAHVDT